MKKTVKYKCETCIDSSTKEYRKKCSTCALSSYLTEQGVKYVDILEGEVAKELFCPYSGVPLAIVHEKSAENTCAAIKMSADEMKKARKKRANDHFKKEILPTFNPDSAEGRHFIKKYGRK